ncbi:hypothetical protein RF679_05915 [Undibacterium cyanobacteriorum]|uniref:Acyltransferase 3 domain-containing protein n=1 Tax=Undibacterium cyanobacteriorum TaxID=3073561 RepID=A0ABY9RKS1_9BURK|nr:hypothetical protein [Undibacterium sp. 20NA77.5]WMW81816.1 hypothetical protein RF679_05915 [Undibacterium sp. 20NA77.5]
MYQLSPFERIYFLSWIGLSKISLGLFFAHWRVLKPELRAYIRFLLVPWKLAFFAPAFIFLCSAGPHTNDPTWDVVTGGGMALLTFLSAPWSVGVLAQYQSNESANSTWWRTWLAVFALFFSSSWFYDGYLLWRDGFYTPRWSSNLMISSCIYVAAGLFWNLEMEDRDDFSRRHFAFEREDWPILHPTSKILPPLRHLFPLLLIAIFGITGFVIWQI